MPIHSDWSDWLIRDIEDAAPDDVMVWYLGCNGAILKGADGTILYIDPYLGTGDPPRTVRMIPVPFDPTDVEEVDGILVTHEHTDHVHGPSQAPILERTGATLYAPDAAMAVAYDEENWTGSWNIADEQLREVKPGESIDIEGFTVYIRSSNDPLAEGDVSYVIEHDGTVFFHGGDTHPGPALDEIGREFDLDAGMLAFGSEGVLRDSETGEFETKTTSWYMDENEIIDAANSLKLDRLIPTHYDMWRGFGADPTALHDHVTSFKYPNRVDILRIGDSTLL